MLLLWVEYVPHVFIGAAALIVLAVAADFAIAKVRGLSQRLRKTSPVEVAKTVDSVTLERENVQSVRSEPVAAPDDKILATVDVQERMVRDTDRRLPLGAPTERCEAVSQGAETERCEAVPAMLEPAPDSSTFSQLGEERRSDSASLVARAARELMQRSGRVEDAVVTRDPSVRIVDVAVASSSRVAS